MADMKPNETELELLLYKTLLKDASFLPIIYSKLDPRIFSKTCFEEVAGFFKRFFKEKKRVPTTSDLRLFTSDEKFAASVKEAWLLVKSVNPEEIPKNELYEYFETFIKKRLALITFKDIFNNYDPNSELDADELVDKFTNIASVKLVQNAGFDIYDDVEKFISSVRANDLKIATGFEQIDKVLGGGLPSNGKCLSVVSAPTNMGKSIFLANVAVNAVKQGKNVLVVSLEMSETVYAQRVYADLYNMPINSIPMLSEELRQNVVESVNSSHYGKMTIKEFPPNTLTVRALDGFIDDLVMRGHKFDLICVDYVTLLHAVNCDNSNECGKMNSRELRAISYKYACPVFTAAQINREGMNTTPDMRFFAESIAICAEADFIVSLYRQEEDVALGVMRAAILKSRFGPKGMTIPLRFNIENLRFENMLEGEVLDVEEGTPAEAINAMNLGFNAL